MNEKKIREIAKQNGFDKIYELIKFGDFWEVIGSMGGDTITFRIYNNGMITEC